jgi:hypothetical protein
MDGGGRGTNTGNIGAKKKIPHPFRACTRHACAVCVMGDAAREVRVYNGPEGPEQEGPGSKLTTHVPGEGKREEHNGDPPPPPPPH